MFFFSTKININIIKCKKKATTKNESSAFIFFSFFFKVYFNCCYEQQLAKTTNAYLSCFYINFKSKIKKSKKIKKM